MRVDSHVRAGYRIPVHYDSMIAKLIVAGPDRETARAGMLAALAAFRIEGVATTIPVHRRILQDPGFAAGDYDTGLVSRVLEDGATALAKEGAWPKS